MIHPEEVNRYLNRKRDSFAWIKQVPEKELDRELRAIGFSPADPSALPLKPHQKACILICLACPQFALYLDMGVGKTRIVLEVMHHVFKDRKLPLILVLVPSEPAVFSWQAQIETWGIPFPVHAVGNSASSKKWDVFAKADGGFLIMTYPGLARMLSDPEKNKKGKTRLVRNPKDTAKFVRNIGAVIYDESTESGSYNTVTFRVCRTVSKQAHYRYTLAGRPFGRDPQVLWTQQWLVDHGDTLGETMGLFRGAFFSESAGWFGGTKYRFIKKMQGKFAEVLQHRSIAYDSKECQKLPPVTHIVETVRLPEDAKVYYQKAVEAIRKAKGNRVEINNQFLRMRQISSGFLGYKDFPEDDEKGQKAEFWFSKNPKQDRLLELIQEMPGDRKAVVFYEFTPSAQSIVQALDKVKVKYGWLWSGTKDSQSLLRQFDNDRKMQVFLVNWRMGSMALNLQVANYSIMYETPVSPIKRSQAEKRTFREGQTLPGFLIDLICRGTVDQSVLDMLKEGEDFFDAVIRNPDKVKLL